MTTQGTLTRASDLVGQAEIVVKDLVTEDSSSPEGLSGREKEIQSAINLLVRAAAELTKLLF